MTDEDYIKIAIQEAQAGIRTGQTPFGACIVRQGQILTQAHNQVWMTTDITAHAEICAIRRACLAINSIDLSGSTIYSTTEPCPMCFSAIHWARIHRIVFGTRITDARSFGFHELEISNERLKTLGGLSVQIVGGCLPNDCLELFHQWSVGNHRRVY